jgi:hypothetical protein
MTDTQELDDLISTARYQGATVIVEYDAQAKAEEGRRVYETIQVSGLEGIGPHPMSPISAAEALRSANHRALHGLCRHNKRRALCLRCRYNGITI